MTDTEVVLVVCLCLAAVAVAAGAMIVQSKESGRREARLLTLLATVIDGRGRFDSKLLDAAVSTTPGEYARVRSVEARAESDTAVSRFRSEVDDILAEALADMGDIPVHGLDGEA